MESHVTSERRGSGRWRWDWVRAGTFCLALAMGFLFPVFGEEVEGSGLKRPNFLWLTWEDAGPHLGAYGDSKARTPHLDRLAETGMRFRRAWSVAPVCAPARTAIITGCYPSATGGEPMRSLVPIPTGMRMFPQWLREAGYYCSNNSKEDYNLAPAGQVWDESSPRAHWRKRASGQPFFAVFNYTESHESQIRRRPHTFVQDPAEVRVPGYMPDLPETREAWAQYYDQVSVVDARVGAALKELADAGLEEDTIVVAFGDHGPGLPRNKRSACDSGLRVPMIVRFPERWRHLAPPEYQEGGESLRLVSFVDLAPTMLSLAGLRPPSSMHGRAWAGGQRTTDPRYLFGQRSRMDERLDLVRSVTDGRYVYVRNFHRHRPHGQRVEYLFETPATRAWWAAYQEGNLPVAQRAYWEPRAAEELYDLEVDPEELRNLATEGGSDKVLRRMRRVLREHMMEVGDLGLLPEAEVGRRAAGGAPGDLRARRDASGLDARRLWEAADYASRGSAGEARRLGRMAEDNDSGVRYWAAMGWLMRGEGAIQGGVSSLRRLLNDANPSVRVPAAEALVRHGAEEDRERALKVLVDLADARKHDYLDVVAAWNALDALSPWTGGIRSELLALPAQAPAGVPGRMNDYLGRLQRSVAREGGGG